MHDHGDGSVDWDAMAGVIDAQAVVYEASDREVAAWLAEGGPTRIADVGCGPGAMTIALAGACPDARLMAADAASAMRAATLDAVRAARLDDRVEVAALDLADLVGWDWAPDLIWAGSVVHHLPDQLAGLRALRVALAPGGRLALGEGGLPTRCLPWDVGIGRPGLEARVDVAQSVWFEDHRASLGPTVPAPLGWPSLLRHAGFAEASTRTFLVEHAGTLPEGLRSHVVDRLRTGRQRFAAYLSPDDVAALDELTDEASTHFVGRRDDLGYLTARSVHVGLAR